MNPWGTSTPNLRLTIDFNAPGIVTREGLYFLKIFKKYSRKSEEAKNI